MHSEDVLKHSRTGVWSWNTTTGATTVDVLCAELMGIPFRHDERAGAGCAPGGTMTVTEAAFRSHFHYADFVELTTKGMLSLAEGRLVEVVARVIDREGNLLRRVRSRMAPAEYEGQQCLVGTIEEVVAAERAVAEPPGSETGGDLEQSRAAFLHYTGRAFAEARTTADVLRVAGSLGLPGAEPRYLVVYSLEGGRLNLVGPVAQRPLPKTLLPFMDMSVDAEHPAAHVVKTGRPVYLESPEEFRSRYPKAWVHAQRIGNRSWAYVPLAVSHRMLGAWLVAFGEPRRFTPDLRALLHNVALMLAQALSRTSMHEMELQLSSGLQRTLRPARRPVIEGMKMASRYMPSGGGLEVGGDWYDVIPLPSGRTALVIGDVQGHDVRAAGIMAQLRIALRAYAAEGHRPDAVLSRASRYLAGIGHPEVMTGSPDDEPTGEHDRRPSSRDAAPSLDFTDDDRFATCLYMEADPLAGTLEIARAGHHDPAVFLPDGSLFLRSTAGGLPLGIDPGSEYPMTRLVLEPGETLLACTDGLIEFGGHTLDTGWARIQSVLREQIGAQAFRAGATGAGGQAVPDLERCAEALVNSVLQPFADEPAGPLADRREDDVALLLLSLDPAYAAERASAAAGVSRRTRFTVAQAEPDRIGDARHQLQAMLFDWESEDQVDGAVLMLSEMLTNVLVHTEGDAVVVAECSGSRGSRLLRVDVADTSDALPHRRSPGELASSGRGLMLMEMLAGTWGVDPSGEGKTIWFEMREDEPTPAWA